MGTLDLDRKESIEVLLQKAGVRLTTLMTSSVALGVYRVAISESFHFPQASRAYFENGPTRIVEDIAALLQSASDRAEIEPLNVTDAARQFIAMLRGNLYLEIVFGCRQTPDGDEIEKRVSSVVDLFLHGIRKDPCDWKATVGEETAVEEVCAR